eukprot:3526624-Prymnesium_polylepis.1
MPNYWDGEGQLPQYDKETKGTFETLTEAVESLSADSPLLTGREEVRRRAPPPTAFAAATRRRVLPH